MRRFARALSLVLLALTLAGCKSVLGGDKEKDKTTDPANGTGQTKDWDYSLSYTGSLSIKQGGTDTLIFTITRTGGFTGAVTLTPFIVGQGITSSVENITSTGAVTTARLIIFVPTGYQPGAQILCGVAAQPATDALQPKDVQFNLTVTAKDGTFIHAPATLSIGRGQTGTLRTTITRTNYTAPVPFELSGAPDGVTATFSPNPVPDTIVVATISVASTAVEGVYNIGIRANAGTTFQGTAPVALTITPPGTVTISSNLPTVIVRQGSSTPVQINIVRNNYSGPLSFAVTGLPVNVNSSVTQATGTTFATITFNAAANAATGTSTVTITASAPGLTSAVTTLQLQVSN